MINNNVGSSPISKSVEWVVITKYFPPGITFAELRSIAIILCNTLNLPKVPRDCKRKSNLLIEWYLKEWKYIEPYLPCVSLYDDNYNKIPTL